MLDRLVRFADTRGCRRQNLLRYFGDADAPRGCEACESCKGSRAPDADEVAATTRKRKPPEPASTEQSPFDEQVFEKLRALRSELARETKVPPYVVFHDATLRELARALPRDEKSFLAVKGAGPGRWQRYGERVVAIVRDARLTETTPPVQKTPLASPPPHSVHEASVGVGYGIPAGHRGIGDELWTLCASGATLGDICARLRRSAADVASELADGMRKGRSLDVARLLGPDRVETIRTAARGSNGDVVALRRRLPFQAALAEIRLALTVA
jgi:hypothetical protein